MQLFLEENSFKFGDERAPSISPDNVPSAQNLGLKNYYSTYQADMKNGHLGYIYKANHTVFPTMGCSHEFLARYSSAIGFVQIFLELYVVRFLDEISTFITRQQTKDSRFLSELLKNENEYNGNKTIGYGSIINRLEILFKDESSIQKQYRIPDKYRFFKNHIETLRILAEWRNKTMHSGEQVLYYYAFDFLFVNHVFPMVKEIVKIEENTTPINRNLHCDLNVIEEFNKLYFKEDYLEVEKYGEVNYLSNYVNHLKELGRASLDNPLFMGDWETEETRDNYEIINEQTRQIAEIEANVTQEPLNYYGRFICPCCGTKTLMTLHLMTDCTDNTKRPYRAKCLLCSYSISRLIGEPMDYGIMSESIFNALKNE